MIGKSWEEDGMKKGEVIGCFIGERKRGRMRVDCDDGVMKGGFIRGEDEGGDKNGVSRKL